MKKPLKKRLLAAILALALLAALSACSGKTVETTESPAPPETAQGSSASEAPESPAEASDEPVSEPVEEVSTVTYPIPGDYTLTMVQNLMNNASAVLPNATYADQYCYETICKKTGVTIDFIMIGEAAYSEQLNLIVASQEYPDIFGQGIGSYDTNVIKAIQDEVIIDFSDMVAQYMPDYYALLQAYPDYADSVYNTDGSLSKVTSCNINLQTQGMYVRGDWLNKLGLEVPKTIDDLTEVCRAFHTEFGTTMTLLVNSDLDDGLSTSFGHSAVGLSKQMMGFQQTAPNSGEVICTTASEGYIQHLGLLRQYYEEGLINEDFLTISKEYGNFESSYYTGICGFWQDGCEIADASYAANANDPDWTATAIAAPAPEGAENHMSVFTEKSTGLSSSFISATCEHPAVALQFLNYGFTEEGKSLVAFGILNETYTIDENGNVAFTDLIMEHPQGSRNAEWLYLCSGWMPVLQQESALNMRYTSQAPVDAYTLWTEIAKAGDDTMVIPQKATLTTEEQDIVSSKQGDISTHFAEAAAKYIMGEIDEAGYRSAIETAQKLGLDEVTAIYQAAFDRYMEKNS